MERGGSRVGGVGSGGGRIVEAREMAGVDVRRGGGRSGGRIVEAREMAGVDDRRGGGGGRGGGGLLRVIYIFHRRKK